MRISFRDHACTQGTDQSAGGSGTVARPLMIRRRPFPSPTCYLCCHFLYPSTIPAFLPTPPHHRHPPPRHHLHLRHRHRPHPPPHRHRHHPPSPPPTTPTISKNDGWGLESSRLTTSTLRRSIKRPNHDATFSMPLKKLWCHSEILRPKALWPPTRPWWL